VGSAGQPLSLSLKTSRRAVSSVSPSLLHAPACPHALENLFPACDQVKKTKMTFFFSNFSTKYTGSDFPFPKKRPLARGWGAMLEVFFRKIQGSINNFSPQYQESEK
jgi:hypothetical protein